MQGKTTYSSGWRKRGDEVSKSRQASKLSNTLKFGLPLLSGFVLALVCAWPVIKDLQTDPSIASMEKLLKTNTKMGNKLINPVLQSLDKKGAPFTIRASSATMVDQKNTSFENPSGKLSLKDGSILSFSAISGVHQKDNNVMDLNGSVRLVTNKGYDLKTNSARFFLSSSQGEGHEHTEGTGPNNETIHAQGFKISDKGDVIHFTGKVKITLPAG